MPNPLSPKACIASIADILLSDVILLDDDGGRAVAAAASKIVSAIDRPDDAAALDLAHKAARDVRSPDFNALSRADFRLVVEEHARKIINAEPVFIERGDKVSAKFYANAEPETPVYWPENSEGPVTKGEFLLLTARTLSLFTSCDRQHPATLIEDWQADELGEGFFGGEPTDRIVYGHHDNGMFLVIYGKNDIPLYKETHQDLSDLRRLLGRELCERVLADKGLPDPESLPHYRTIKLEPDEFYFNDEMAVAPSAPKV